MYIRKKDAGTEYPYSLEKLVNDNPGTSFPDALTQDLLEAWGVYPVLATKRPDVDHTKDVFEDMPSMVGGAWHQVWRVEASSPDDVAQRVETRLVEIRSARNAMLLGSDWTQLPDAPVDRQVWADYRQALRDITIQADPFNIEWPTSPR